MKIAGTAQDSIVDGPGLRFVVFTQGCDKKCEGCHNPATWDIGGGTDIPVEDLKKVMLENPLIDGLTLSGGEPFLQATECAELASAARRANLSVWVYSGYTFEELLSRSVKDLHTRKLLELSDVLVDGAFDLSKRTLSLKWRGSLNQRLIDVKKSIEFSKAVEMEV